MASSPGRRRLDPLWHTEPWGTRNAESCWWTHEFGALDDLAREVVGMIWDDGIVVMLVWDGMGQSQLSNSG